VEEYLTAKK